MTARNLLALLTVGAVLLGVFCAVTILTAVNMRQQTMRLDAGIEQAVKLRDRVVADELAFCRVLALSPDHQQSRQIAELARLLRREQIAGDALDNSTIRRVPPQCGP